MFTGIVEEAGTFLSLANDTLSIGATTVLEDTKIGDSISVNGCCLTVVRIESDYWEANVMDETLKRTNLGFLKPGEMVNLERAAKMNDRIGGHIVQGHVDAVGELLAPAPNIRVRLPESLLKYIVEKGSITIDGVSLTVVNLYPDGFDVSLIEHTMQVTNLGDKKVGAKVNIEVDVMAKYAERILTYSKS